MTDAAVDAVTGGISRRELLLFELDHLDRRHQPASALSIWFRERAGDRRGRVRRIAIVATARKLLIALWHYVTQGVLPKGAALKAA